MDSEPPLIETGPKEPGQATGRLAYSVDEAAHLTGLSRELLYDQISAEVPRRCFGWKIWSMTSAPVVITGRSSRNGGVGYSNCPNAPPER
jgi:hypothetical protein